MKKGRLIIAITTTLLDDIVIIGLIVWGLPRLGIANPMPLVVFLVTIWTAFAALLYFKGGQILWKKAVPGMTDMIGMRGTVALPINSEGMVKIKGELWSARSADGRLERGVEIIVTAQQNMVLTVRKYLGER